MTCYNPLVGYRSKYRNHNGKQPIVFKESFSDGNGSLPIPCGQCIGCRLEYSRQWALRCHHEAQMHKHNAFLTLTYNNENLPSNYSIDKREVQLFIKRLRKRIPKIKHYSCGEYGEQNNRPHYHSLIFGYDFPDKVLHQITKDGMPLFRSPTLEKAWNKGFSLIGEVTFQSAAYVSRYMLKKRKGAPDTKDKHGKTNAEYYQLLDRQTGEIHQQHPEFALMSRGGTKGRGIGYAWLQHYKGDTNKDFITLNGQKMGLPKYYDSILEAENPEDFLRRKEKRQSHIKPSDNTLVRLATREAVKVGQINQLKRGYESNET